MEEKMKIIDGTSYPASDFAYTPDKSKPSTWKLPIFDMRHVGDAEAAMNSDFRGNAVEIPPNERAEVMQKILERRAKFELQDNRKREI